MTFLRPHRFWITLATFAIIIMIGSGPAIDIARNEAQHNLDQIKAERAKTDKNLAQLRENVAAARKLYSQMDRVRADKILAPVNRLKAAEMMEHEAAGIRHFTYTLAPEDHVTINTGGETQELASSPITLSGEASDDTAVYGLIQRVQQQLPGRARVKQLTLSRMDAHALGAANIKFEAALEWICNGSVQTLAGAQ